MKTVVRKTIAVSLATLGLVSGTLGYFVSEHYVLHRPATPQPELLRTYSYNIHGTVVYLTHSERLMVYSSTYVFFGSLLLLVLWQVASAFFQDGG
jgi:hypothetical protein